MFHLDRNELAVYANAAFLDDPKHPSHRLPRHQLQHASTGGVDRRMGLVTQAQDDDSGELSRWVGENVGKVEVERDEHSILAPAHIDVAFVRLTAESLLNDRMCFMSRGGEHCGQ